MFMVILFIYKISQCEIAESKELDAPELFSEISCSEIGRFIIKVIKSIKKSCILPTYIMVDINFIVIEVMGRMDKTKILVVDDAFFMRKYLGNTLNSLGYSNVEFAENGYEAVEKAKEMQPHVVTLDVSMPGMDGIEAIEKILKVSTGSKIIMVSAVTSERVIHQAMKNGAVDYIPKPFSRKDVEKSLKKYVNTAV